MSKTVLFRKIQFSINTQFSSIWPIDSTLSGATILGQSEPGSDGIEGVFHILQCTNTTGPSPSDCIVAFPGYSSGEFYPYADKQSVYSTAPIRLGKVFFF